jgi:hypothetical protein
MDNFTFTRCPFNAIEFLPLFNLRISITRSVTSKNGGDCIALKTTENAHM